MELPYNMTMGDERHHTTLVVEKRDGARAEFRMNRYTNVADLALKAVEQAVEAAVSRLGLHFHTNPRSAHLERGRWLKQNLSEVATDFDMLWSACGDLGYDGLDGKRAREALQSMEKILNAIEAKTGVRFGKHR